MEELHGEVKGTEHSFSILGTHGQDTCTFRMHFQLTSPSSNSLSYFKGTRNVSIETTGVRTLCKNKVNVRCCYLRQLVKLAFKISLLIQMCHSGGRSQLL